MRLPEFRAWIRKDKKMMGVKLIGGGYCWLDDVWIDSKTNLNATAHEIGVTCDVMEWTGLRDRNGREIFEGDIVRDEYKRIMLVAWNRNGLQFKALTETNFIWAEDITQWFTDYAPFPEIIGNVFETPEMVGKP